MIVFIIAPIAAVIIGLAMVFSAKKEYLSDDMNSREIDEKTAKSRFLICEFYIASTFIFGFLCYMISYSREISEMTPVLWICAALVALGAVIGGALTSKSIRSGDIFKQNGFAKTVLLACLGEGVSMLGLLVYIIYLNRII